MNFRSKKTPNPHAFWILEWRHLDEIQFHLNSFLLLLLDFPHFVRTTHLWVKWSGEGPPPESRGNEEHESVGLFFSFVSFVFFFFVYSFVHEQSREVRGGDDSGSVRPTGSVSFRERKREETPTVSLSSHFFLERRKFRRRKPKRFHVSPPSFRFNSFSFVLSRVFVFIKHILSWKKENVASTESFQVGS